MAGPGGNSATPGGGRDFLCRNYWGVEWSWRVMKKVWMRMKRMLVMLLWMRVQRLWMWMSRMQMRLSRIWVRMKRVVMGEVCAWIKMVKNIMMWNMTKEFCLSMNFQRIWWRVVFLKL